MSEFPSRAEGIAAWDAGYEDGRANRERGQTPRAGASFAERCLIRSYLKGWNQGRHELAQNLYGNPA